VFSVALPVAVRRVVLRSVDNL